MNAGRAVVVNTRIADKTEKSATLTSVLKPTRSHKPALVVSRGIFHSFVGWKSCGECLGCQRSTKNLPTMKNIITSRITERM